MSADKEDHTVVIHVTPGELLDERWRIESRIGQGAMGSVFRGRDLKANRLIAIKILAPEHCRKPKVLARFEREAEAMLSLKHPNIVQLYGHGRRGALPYIVMELLDGLTLADVLTKRASPLPLAETIAVVKQVAQGLAFLHHNNLVHRDVKPQNIVISAEGRVTILDLGVVRDQSNPGLTRPGAMVGTPYYMSPEQIYGVDDIDRRTDVYALAAMTFELLTGRPPFLGNNNFEVLYGHKNVAPPDASTLVKGLPKPVAQVLMRGMAKQRDERPDTVTELVADLEAAAGVKRVDLARAFASAFARPKPSLAVEKTSVLPSVSAEATRMVPRHQPRAAAVTPSETPVSEVVATSGEIPMAEDRDVDSVPESKVLVPPPTKRVPADGKTVLLEIASESTYVGKAPTGRDQDYTRHLTVPDLKPVPEPPQDSGTLEVVVTVKNRAVRASVTIDERTRALSPCTVTLAPGRHEVRVELAGYETAVKNADLPPHGRAVLRVTLERP